MFFFTDYPPYALLSITLHAANAVLVFYLSRKLLKNTLAAAVAAVFFIVNSIPEQAVTWVAASNSYEAPTLFILISLIFFHRFLSQKKYRRTNIFICFGMLFISLLFHENGMFLFLFYPALFFIQAKQEWKLRLSDFLKGWLVAFGMFIMVRVPLFFGLTAKLPLVTDTSAPSPFVYPYRLISLPFKSFAGSVIPEKMLIGLSETFVRVAYPQFITGDTPNPFITQSVVFDLVSYIVSTVIILTLVVFVFYSRDKARAQTILWILLFVAGSMVPYVFVLGKAGYASILEPKFFYVASIGISVLIGIISTVAASRKWVYLLLSIYLAGHLFAVRSSIDTQVAIGTSRKSFLTTIVSSHPTLPPHVVFYTQSDTAYYGMPDNEKILPVQIGFGKMLMVWYQKHERFPGCLYQGQFLLGLLEQGYRNCDGRGFGYFREYTTLVNAVAANRIPVGNVISYSFRGKTGGFTDITDEIRAKLTKDSTHETYE